MLLHHPLSGTVYTRLPDARVLARDEQGREGIFDRLGRWTEGERRSADPEMCSWVSDGYLLSLPTAEEATR